MSEEEPLSLDAWETIIKGPGIRARGLSPYLTTSAGTGGIMVPSAPTNKLTLEKVSNGYIVREKGEELLVFNDFYDMCNHIRAKFGEPEPNEPSNIH
jgi:hypothetical protein